MTDVKQRPATTVETKLTALKLNALADVKQPMEKKLSAFEQFAKRKELSSDVAAQLQRVLSSCDIVLVCDDSGSMAQPIVDGDALATGATGATPNKPSSTRWLELKKLAASLIEIITVVNSNGLDIYFLNRGVLRAVTSTAGLQDTFKDAPAGGTPLLGTLRTVFAEKYTAATYPTRELLVVVITDGAPSDGNLEDLKYLLMTKPSNVHISLAECTDNEEDMKYLDEWDGQVPKFDNTDDYRQELKRVKAAQGQQFKFDYTDYVIKILLATFVRKYYMIDQQNPANASCCCAIL